MQCACTDKGQDVYSIPRVQTYRRPVHVTNCYSYYMQSFGYSEPIHGHLRPVISGRHSCVIDIWEKMLLGRVQLKLCTCFFELPG